MALLYHPRPGEIVICDYRGFIIPERVKRQPVIILSPRLRRRNRLCTVVPLSTSRPDPVEEYHCRIELTRPLPPPFQKTPVWAKCDMLATVSFDRLQLIAIGRTKSGKRKYIQPSIGPDALEQIQLCVVKALGLSIDR